MTGIQRTLLLILALLVGAAVVFGVSGQVFGGSVEGMLNTPSYLNILIVNVLVGVSVTLFVIELKWDAIRVTLTVIFALFLGYLVTMWFNADAAARFSQGEALVQVLSEAEPVENDDVDLEYGRRRGVEFNEPDVLEPVSELSVTFEGRGGDVVDVLAFAANRRSEVNMQLELLGPGGDVVARADSATPEQIERYGDMDIDVRFERDAVVAGFALPEDGVYTIVAAPESVGFGTSFRESVAATNVAYDAFLLGPLSRPNRWAVWIQDAITLILVGLSISIVFRAEQFSLGAEGQLYFGALVSGVIALGLGNLPGILVIPIALIASVTAGFLYGLLPGALKAYLGANELVSTLMLNVVALRFYELVLTFQLRPEDAGYVASEFFGAGGVLPPIVEGTQVTIAVYLVAIVTVLSWLLMRRTPLGYQLRLIGSNIRFAEYGGIATRRNVMLAMAISGAVAGLAGAHLGMGVHRRLILNISLGLAFEGVVVALLARNNVLVAPFTGLLYAYLRAGAQFMERDANVSFEVVRVIQAVIILLITAEALVTMFRRRQIRRRGTVELAVEEETPTPTPPDVKEKGTATNV